MTKSHQLYQKLLDTPSLIISFCNFEKLLEAAGFVYDRTVGSHRQYAHPLVPRPLPVQPERKDAKRYQVRMFVAMVETYGLKVE